MRTLRQAHRLNAYPLVAFIALHLINHLSLIGGTDMHLAVQHAIRPIYRSFPMEAILIGLFAMQIALGCAMLIKSGLGRGSARWQRLSGLYLAFFLVVHISVVLLSRGDPNIDTNVHFAAAGFFIPWGGLFFYPYYGLAIIAVTLHFRPLISSQFTRTTKALPLLGVVLAAVILTGLVGGFGGPKPPNVYVDRLDLMSTRD